MKINKAKLKIPAGARHEFFWIDNGVTVAIFHYDNMGTYTGSTKIRTANARGSWNRLVKEGWTRYGRTLQLPVHLLHPNERALVDYLN